MLKDNDDMLRKAMRLFLTYIVLVLIESIVSWAFINGVYAQLKSIPEITRRGYENPFLSYIGFALLNLFLTFVIYTIAIAVIPKTRRTTTIKVIIGVIAGVLPITVMYAGTFGIPYSSLADMTDILLITIAGGFIPIIENKIASSLHKK